MPLNSQPITFEEIYEKALQLGWDDAGITQAVIPLEDAQAYSLWLDEGLHGDLEYMTNRIRTDPKQLLPNARFALIFISNYKQPHAPFKEDTGVVASYARGRDYHNVHFRRSKRMIRYLEERSGQKNIARSFSDSKPIMEKALAVQAGLGWFGKNSLLIHRRFGTFVLISGILTTLDITHTPLRIYRDARCGVCTRCLDACPTGALISPYKIDAAKCLSYHLIEKKGPVQKNIQEKNPGYAFGCDICQDVCPHNQRSPCATSSDFQPSSGVGAYLTLEEIDTIKLEGTPLKRRGIEGLRHNLDSSSPHRG